MEKGETLLYSRQGQLKLHVQALFEAWLAISWELLNSGMNGSAKIVLGNVYTANMEVGNGVGGKCLWPLTGFCLLIP